MEDTSQARTTYSIKEAAGLTGLPASTLRYYESVGIITSISRGESSKHRAYTEEDLDILMSVACLSATGMSIDEMRTYIKNRGKGVSVADEQADILKIQKRRLIEEAKYLRVRQNYVDLKISYWEAVKAGNDEEASSIAARAKTLMHHLKKGTKK